MLMIKKVAKKSTAGKPAAKVKATATKKSVRTQPLDPPFDTHNKYVALSAQ